MRNTTFNQDDSLKSKIVELINEKVISSGKEKIAELYDYLIDHSLEKEEGNKKQVFSANEISGSQNIPSGSKIVRAGIDLPIWYGKSDLNKGKKIMLLGIDPLRNAATFRKFTANEESEVIIGTPYAMHCAEMRKGKTKRYSDFIKDISQNNFVYVTDIFKTYYMNETTNKRSYVEYVTDKEKLNSAIDLLKSEISIVKPDVIITLGGVACRTINDNKCPKLSNKTKVLEPQSLKGLGVNLIPMLHLSKGTRDKYFKAYFDLYDLGELAERNRHGEAYSVIIRDLLKKL